MPNLMWGCLSKRHTVEQKTSCELFSLYTVAPLGTLFSQVQQVLLNFELAMTSVTVVSDTAAADASFLFTVESALNSTSSCGMMRSYGTVIRSRPLTSMQPCLD